MTATTAEPTLADIAARLDTLSSQVEALAECNRERELARQVWTDLSADVTPVATAAFGRVVTELEERRNYFPFAKAGLGVMDRVVDSFTEDDVEQLGDNIVLILHTIKEMTQPEIMRALQRTAKVVREDDRETPSLRRLLGEMRDPAVKRGLHRLLAVLRSLSEESEEEITYNGQQAREERRR